MPYVKGQMAPKQIVFFHELEKGEKTPDEILEGMGIRRRTLGAWLQVGKFARRYQMTIRNLKAQAEAIEVVGKVKRARRQMGEGSEATREERIEEAAAEITLAATEESAMARRLIELHGSAEGVAKKSGMMVEVGEENDQ